MILSAQLKQTPIPSAPSKSPPSIDGVVNPGVTSASASSSSPQFPTISLPRDLVQQKLSGGDSSVQSDAHSDAQPASTSAAAPANQSGQARGVHRGREDPGSPGADAQSSPGMPGRAEAAAGSSPGEPLQTDYLFHFGDTTEIRKALEMPNRLTG